jgi:hypothetical protein
VANYEAEWRQLTDIVEQDRRSREAQRQRDIAARERQMVALFKQEPSSCGGAAGPVGKRGSRAAAANAMAGRTPPGSSGGSAGADCGAKATDVAAATVLERVRQLKEAFSKVLAATGEQQGWQCCLPGGCMAGAAVLA